MLEKKIVLGTANFGTKYGFFSKKNLEIDEIKNIILFCNERGINTLDTSQDYKYSEKYIGKMNVDNFNIITKIPVLDNNIIDANKFLSHKNNK